MVDAACRPVCGPNDALPMPTNNMPPLVACCSGGGGGGALVTADSDSIDLIGDGSLLTPLSAEVIIDPAPDNALVLNPAGLYAASGGIVLVNVLDTATVDLGGDGTAPSPITADVILSANAGNQITAEVDGLFVPAPPASIDSVVAVDSNDINFSGDGTPGTPLTASVILDPDGGNLLSSSAAGLMATLPAGLLSAVASNDSASTTVSGDGTAGTPLEVDVNISATAGNQLVENIDGLFVPAAAVTIATSDTPSIDLGGDGSGGSPLTAAVKLSATAGNAITTNADGIYAPVVTPGIASVTTSDTPTIDFSGDGTGGSPLAASVIVDPAASNQLLSGPGGLAVSPLVTIQDIPGAAASVVEANTRNVYMRFSNAGVKTLTVQPNATIAIPIGAVAAFVNAGAGLLTIIAGGGVTINKPATQTFDFALFAAGTLTKVGTDEWDLAGGMEAV